MRVALGAMAALLETLGVAIVAMHFDAQEAWLFVGLTLGLAGMFCANAAFNCSLARNLDEEFEAGYRVGYRAGRRAPLVPQSVADLDTFRKRRSENGRIPQAPFRAMAGHGAAARWETPHPN